MISALFELAVLWGLLQLIRKRTAAALAATFLLFSLISRSVSLVYVDLAGPIYAEQLGRMVGGKPSMPMFAAYILMIMAVLAFTFRPSVLRRARPPHPGRHRRIQILGNVLFVFTSVFVVVLYGDMLWRGVVPLFHGIDRLEYNEKIAGPLHMWLAQMGFLLAGTLGMGFCMPRLLGRDFDLRFLALYISLIAYFAMTGNRFSIFYSFTSFFVLPVASVPAMTSVGLLPKRPFRYGWRRLLFSKSSLVMAIVTATLGISIIILNSIINVRGYDEPEQQLLQRALVQPVELWWATWDDTVNYSEVSFAEAWYDLFTNPIDPTRNTTMQMLMIKHLAYDRAAELVDMGQQYAGGYPEVLLELLGPWLALPVAFIFSLVTATLLRLVVLAVCEGRWLTSFMGLYVFFGFSLLFIGGMLNFFLVWTFWVKLTVLSVVYAVERSLLNKTPLFTPKAWAAARP